MPHETALLATLAIGFGLAFLFGLVAVRLRLPPLVGYLIAGIAVGPFTPGYVANAAIAAQLAEIGVILLMFGVGIHFSTRDLLAARRIALPGALAQMAVATLLGGAVATWWGWSLGGALVFGLSLSVASTVVVLKSLDARGLLDSAHGRTAVGWLVVEDLAMVFALVLIPAVAGMLGGLAPPGAEQGGAAVLATIGITLAKVALFVALMAVVGRRAVPWLLARVARTGSRELFTLGVLAVALGIAVGAAALFDVSLALGAFFAGVVISESDLSHQASADALPLQDAFAVLFFVSVGMLFDPMVLVLQPARVVATVTLIVVGNVGASLVALFFLRYPTRPALQISATLGQIGEFSFIVAGLGVSLGLLSEDGRSLVLAGALVSITINPLLVVAANAATRWLDEHPAALAALRRAHRGDAPPAVLHGPLPEWRGHAIVVGAGRVGGTIVDALLHANLPFVIVERERRTAETLRARGHDVIFGDAARPMILAHALPEHARLLVVATPEPYHARRVIELARQANPALDIVVRTHSVDEQARFEAAGVGRVVMGERELALGMAAYALRSFGTGDAAADAIVGALRSVHPRRHIST